jgi:hypothetical protein
VVEAAGHFDSNLIIDPVLKAADAHSRKLHELTPINERQRLIMNNLFDDFERKL